MRISDWSSDVCASDLQIGVPELEAAEIVVPLRVAIEMPGIPVTRRDAAIDQCTVVQHRQIEAATVLLHTHRPILLAAIEDALNQLAFARLFLAYQPARAPVALPHPARNRDHPAPVPQHEYCAF